MIENLTPLTMEGVMSLVLFVLVNLLVLASICGMIRFLVHVIMNDPDFTERLLRVAAFGAGLLTYVGAKAIGVSIPELMASSLSVSAPFSFGALGVVFPAAAGTFVAWFCLRLMKKDTDRTARGLVLFSAFFFTMFADVYATMAAQTTSASVDLVTPNITFVLGVVYYTIFMFERESPGEEHRGSLMDGLRKFRDRVNLKRSPDGDELPEESDAESVQEGVGSNAREV